jgi:methylglyoxal synthase
MAAGNAVIVIAHEAHFSDLARLIGSRRQALEGYRLLATEETGAALGEIEGLDVTALFPGRRGGEIQLCGLVCSGAVRAVIFLRDMHTPQPDEPDVTPFYRACDLNNVPLATNVVAAAALLHWLGRKQAADAAGDAPDLQPPEKARVCN